MHSLTWNSKRAALLRLSLVALGIAAFSAGCGTSGETTSATSQTTTAREGSATSQKTAAATDRAPRWQRNVRFRPISQALSVIRRHVDVAVVVPTNLPAGAKAAGRPSIYGSRAQLGIAVPGDRFHLTIQYGVAGFDGCGPLHPRKVVVGDQPAVINTSGGKRPYTTLVWPATLKQLEGRYGLSGAFTDEQMLAFANSMEDARASGPHGPKRNC